MNQYFLSNYQLSDMKVDFCKVTHTASQKYKSIKCKKVHNFGKHMLCMAKNSEY